MNPQLSAVVDALDHAQARLDRLADQVPEDRWGLRHDPSRWSAAECVAHLNLTTAAYIPRIRKAIEQARQLGSATDRHYKRDIIGAFFGFMVGPLPSIGKTRIGRVKTTPAFVPTGNHPKQQLLAEFKKQQIELTLMVKESDGWPVDKVVITSPFGEKIHYNLYSTFILLPRHEERHIQQAELVWSR
jgi:hypothetical protein